MISRVKGKDWFDKALLQPQADIAELQGPDFTVDKQGDEWKLAGDAEQVQKAEIDKLVNAVSHLDVQYAADTKASDKSYALTIKVGDHDLHYRFFKDGDNYFVQPRWLC